MQRHFSRVQQNQQHHSAKLLPTESLVQALGFYLVKIKAIHQGHGNGAQWERAHELISAP
jgi:hypothetical protein